MFFLAINITIVHLALLTFQVKPLVWNQAVDCNLWLTKASTESNRKFLQYNIKILQNKLLEFVLLFLFGL